MSSCSALRAVSTLKKWQTQKPEAIVKVHVDPLRGLLPFHIRQVCYAFDMPKADRKALGNFVKTLYAL